MVGIASKHVDIDTNILESAAVQIDTEAVFGTLGGHLSDSKGLQQSLNFGIHQNHLPLSSELWLSKRGPLGDATILLIRHRCCGEKSISRLHD